MDNSYHENLKGDLERLIAFHEAIKKKVHGIVYDLGTGSGILSILAAPYADFIYAIEIDPSLALKTQEELDCFKNIEVWEADACKLNFYPKPDVIICEMLDTALVDEEQILVLNSVLEKLGNDIEIIPQGVINALEPVHLETDHICYLENKFYKPEIMGKLHIYHIIDFREKIEPYFQKKIRQRILKEGWVSGIKITTFTLMTSNIICGPTPMLNPPLFIPSNKIKVIEGDLIEINLKYHMGGGLDTFKVKITKIS